MREGQGKKEPRICLDYHSMSKEDDEAKKTLMITMATEKTGDNYGRAVGRKHMGEDGLWIG